ncbi:hypothetical protein EBT31_15895 [bacterium]|nr:hypothetical protein [bacterium]
MTTLSKPIHQVSTVRREAFYQSKGRQRVYLFSEIPTLKTEVLKELILETNKEIIQVKAIVAADGPEASVKIRQKLDFLRVFNKGLTNERHRRKKGELAESKHDALLKAYENQKRKVFYQLILGCIGQDKFDQYMQLACDVAKKTHPDPTEPCNRCLWDQEDTW